MELCDKVYKGEIEVSTASKQIQTDYYPRLLMNGTTGVLNTKTKGVCKTLRGKIWSIMLNLNSYSFDAEGTIDQVTKEQLSTMENEMSRLKGKGTIYLTGDENQLRDYRLWLLLFCGWLSKRDQVFEQTLYLFGILFLRNFDLITAFQAFERFFERLHDGYLIDSNKKWVTTNKIVDVLQCCDAELADFMSKSPRFKFSVISYPHISAFFTQAGEVDAVEQLWDFMIIYGIHFVVFIEAAWLMMHREPIMNEINPMEHRDVYIVDKPVELLLLASEVYEKTPKETREMIDKLFYGEPVTD